MYFFLRLIAMIVFVTLSVTNAYANLPDDVYTGYWALGQKVLGEHIVVEFKKQSDGSTLSGVHYFECQSDGKYQPTNRTRAVLIPKNGAMVVYENGKTSPTSYLRLLQYAPKQRLMITQTFTEQLSGLKKVFPDSMVLVYYPTDKLVPLCQGEPK